MNLSGKKPQIDYPCIWKYIIIGRDSAYLHGAIDEVLPARSRKISVSNTSSKGKYVSLLLQIRVFSDQERNSIHHALHNHPAVKIVL